MGKYALRRALLFIPTLLVATTLVFTLFWIVPGDLGTSLWYKTPVWTQVKDRFLVTMELAVMAIVLAFCAAVPLGVVSAVRQDTGFDYASRIFASIGIAL